MLLKIKLKKSRCVSDTLRRKCLLKHVLEGDIGVKGIGGRRRKHVLDDLKKRRYWKLKEEALDLTLWETGFGIGYGFIVIQTALS
jgi:hypothetical protein